MRWRFFILSILLVVAALTLLARRERPDTLPTFTSQQPLQPGYFMTDATVTQTGPDGLPLYRMTAQRIQQNPADQSIDLENPRFAYSAEEQNEWTLTADTGHVPSIDARTIDLRGNVRIVGRTLPAATDDASTPTALVRTPSLKIDAVTGTANTADRVDFFWGNRQISATGLTADLKAERLKLHSSVHGRLTQ